VADHGDADHRQRALADRARCSERDGESQNRGDLAHQRHSHGEQQGDDNRFTECQEGKLKSWVAAVDAGEPGDAFYGYSGPGYREEFWILDVEGTRLMISAGGSADSPPQDIAERQAILDSIRIEP